MLNNLADNDRHKSRHTSTSALSTRQLSHFVLVRKKPINSVRWLPEIESRTCCAFGTQVGCKISSFQFSNNGLHYLASSLFCTNVWSQSGIYSDHWPDSGRGNTASPICHPWCAWIRAHPLWSSDIFAPQLPKDLLWPCNHPCVCNKLCSYTVTP